MPPTQRCRCWRQPPTLAASTSIAHDPSCWTFLLPAQFQVTFIINRTRVLVFFASKRTSSLHAPIPLKLTSSFPCTPHSCSQLKRRCGYFASHRRRLQSSVPLELSFILHFGPLQSISHEALIQVQRVPVLSRGAPAPAQPHRHLTAPLAFLHTPVLNHSGATGHRCPSCADAFPGTTARGCTRATAVAQLLV
jgi:hypothetical protein